MGDTRLRFIHEVGLRVWLRRYWNGDGGHYHDARTHLFDTNGQVMRYVLAYEFGRPEDYQAGWPTSCETCGAPVPESAPKQVFVKRRFDTASGEPERGDIFWRSCTWTSDGRCWYWDNCDGRHLHVILPDGIEWDIDSKASNCSRRDDRMHRCWVRHGEPPDVTVNKGGDTCDAGAGSIATPNYHGMLNDGILRAC